LFAAGRQMLDYVLNTLVPQHPTLSEVYLHVQINNDDAIEFYNKFGFSKSGSIENYYKRITPASCFIVSKHLGTQPEPTNAQ
jgi:N-alpha-acetyltransferase 50